MSSSSRVSKSISEEGVEVNPFVILNNPFPCKTCTAECCSTIPFMKKDWERAIQHLSAKPDLEIIRLMKQTRPLNQCIFVDMETFTCSIYEVRPAICRVFGYHPKGVCSYAPEQATMTQAEADAQMTEQRLGEVYGLSGPISLTGLENIDLHFDWGHVLKAIDPNCEVTRHP